MSDPIKNKATKTAAVQTTRILNNTSGTLSDMKTISQISSAEKKSEQAKSGQEIIMNKSLEIEAESLMTNTKSTAAVTADTAKTEAAAKPKASATRSQTTPKSKRTRTTPKASTSSKVKAPAKTKLSKMQSAKDLLSNQDNDVPDLNASPGYPIHPDRIWPD